MQHIPHMDFIHNNEARISYPMKFSNVPLVIFHNIRWLKRQNVYVSPHDSGFYLKNESNLKFNE